MNVNVHARWAGGHAHAAGGLAAVIGTCENQRMKILILSLATILGSAVAMANSFEVAETLHDGTHAGGSFLETPSGQLRVTGEVAHALYHRLKVPAKTGGEAGPNILFKTGKEYRCFRDTQTGEHACDFQLKMGKGGVD